MNTSNGTGIQAFGVQQGGEAQPETGFSQRTKVALDLQHPPVSYYKHTQISRSQDIIIKQILAHDQNCTLGNKPQTQITKIFRY